MSKIQRVDDMFVQDQRLEDRVANLELFRRLYVPTGGSGGTVADATATTKGVIQLAGDIAGTAAAPVVGPLKITDAKVAAANKDGANNVPSMRTIDQAGAGSAMGAARTLNSIANLNPMTADLGLAGFKLIAVGDPISATDGANKRYVDSVAQGLDAKQSVKAASTTNLTLSGTQTVDGVALIAGDRVLVKNQTAPAENGIYVVASGAWTRAADADVWTELIDAFVFVEQGTANADIGWVCTSDQGGTLGTTAVTWTQFSGAGSIIDGAGLLKTGNTFDVQVDNSSIEIAADILRVKALGITAAMLANGAVDLTGAKITGTLPVANGGTGSTTAKLARESNLGAAGYYTNNGFHAPGTTISIPQATHGLRSSRALIVQCRLASTGEEVIVDNTVSVIGDVTITFAASQAANSIFVTIIG